MMKNEVYQEIARNVISRDDLEEDVLLFMVLLHTHDLQLKENITLDDARPKDMKRPLILRAVTHRHAASIISSLWPPSDKRGTYEYWYGRFTSATPYEVMSDIPEPQRKRLGAIKQRLLDDPRIEAVLEA